MNENSTKAIVKTEQEKNISDNVLNRVKELEQSHDLQLPASYSAPNALKAAWLILQETTDKDKEPVLKSCSKVSIADTLLSMVIQGLNPIKKQCYFVAYGGKLTLMRSYMGTIAVTKRLKGVKNVYANCIYDNDEFAYEIDLDTGLKRITKHDQKFENIDNTKIKGAYAVITRNDEKPYVEIMNINQIQKAWAMGTGYGRSKTHTDFAEEMAKKTVINRACKMFVNTTDDSDILVDAINKTTDAENNEDAIETTEYEVTDEINQNANKREIDIEPKPLPEKKESIKVSKSDKKPEIVKEKVENKENTDQLSMKDCPF